MGEKLVQRRGKIIRRQKTKTKNKRERKGEKKVRKD